MHGKSVAVQNAGERSLRGAYGELPEMASAAEASAKMPDFSALPVSVTPVIVPLYDFLNHADGDLPTNVVIAAGGMPPFSSLERRNHMRTLRRLGLSDDKAEELNRSDKKLSRYSCTCSTTLGERYNYFATSCLVLVLYVLRWPVCLLFVPHLLLSD